MKLLTTLFTCAALLLIVGCEATDQGSCSCEAVTEGRLSPTYQCAAPDMNAGASLCETVDGDLVCEEAGALSAVFSSDDLSCQSVFCISDDGETCHTECACTD